MSKGIESGEWRGERRGDMEGEQREGGRWRKERGACLFWGHRVWEEGQEEEEQC